MVSRGTRGLYDHLLATGSVTHAINPRPQRSCLRIDFMKRWQEYVRQAWTQPIASFGCCTGCLCIHHSVEIDNGYTMKQLNSSSHRIETPLKSCLSRIVAPVSKAIYAYPFVHSKRISPVIGGALAGCRRVSWKIVTSMFSRLLIW